MRIEPTNFEKVREFHKAFGVEIDAEFTTKLADFRDNLIYEEFLEVEEELLYKEQINKEKLTKELADLLYVVYGTGATFGLPLDEAFSLVHESNMSKLAEDGSVLRREDGKVLKGPNYKEPDLSVLFGT